MSLYPEVQRKAQEELDRVVGPRRLPEFDDYDDLVYVRAIMLEAMRWVVVTPLSLPHQVIRDDKYKGYSIPKGTIIRVVSNLPRSSLLIFFSLSIRMSGWYCYITSPNLSQCKNR